MGKYRFKVVTSIATFQRNRYSMDKESAYLIELLCILFVVASSVRRSDPMISEMSTGAVQ